MLQITELNGTRRWCAHSAVAKTFQEWRRLKREPQAAFFVKRARSAEVTRHFLFLEEGRTHVEVDQWIQSEAVMRAVGPLPKGQALHCRTREVTPQSCSVRQRNLFKADGKAAFLQGEAAEEDRLCFASTLG